MGENVPKLPEGQEPPEAVKWARWPVHHFAYGDAVIRQPLIIFMVVVAIVGVLIVIALQRQKAGPDATKDATIENQKSHIATLEEEVKAIAPQQHNINAERRELVEQLQNFYAESVPLFNANLPKNISKEDLDEFESTFNDWVARTATYIENNMGEAAKQRFLNYGPGSSSTWTRAVNEKHNTILNLMWAYRRNLTMLIGSDARDKPN